MIKGDLWACIHENFAAGLRLNRYLRIWSEKLIWTEQAGKGQDGTATLAQKPSVISAPASRTGTTGARGRLGGNRLWGQSEGRGGGRFCL
jgi:hypothetical protein